MKILVAVDGSAYTDYTLDFLAANAPWSDAGNRYTMVHCVMPLPHAAAAFAPPDVVQSYYREDAELVLGPVRAFMQARGTEATLVRRIGSPADHIAELARTGGFDVLVMGSHGHGALAGLVLGSVATRVLTLCTTPVLLLRPGSGGVVTHPVSGSPGVVAS